jgi:hypothetical protein
MISKEFWTEIEKELNDAYHNPQLIEKNDINTFTDSIVSRIINEDRSDKLQIILDEKDDKKTQFDK